LEWEKNRERDQKKHKNILSGNFNKPNNIQTKGLCWRLCFGQRAQHSITTTKQFHVQLEEEKKEQKQIPSFTLSFVYIAFYLYIYISLKI